MNPARYRASDRQTRALTLVAAALGLLAAVAPLWSPYPRLDIVFHVFDVAVGASLAIGGFVAARWRSGRAIARLMLASACLYFVPVLGYSGLGGIEAGFALGLLTEGLWLAVGAHFVVAFPEGRLRAPAERAVVAAAYIETLVIRLVPLFGQPADWGCTGCPPNPVMVTRAPEVVAGVLVVDSVVPIVVASLVALLLVRRWRRASRPERRVLAPVFWAMGINVAIAAFIGIASAAWVAGLVTTEQRVAAVLLQRGGLVLLPLSFGAGMLRGLVNRSAIGNLLVRIGRGVSIADIERDVAWALGDPSATLAVRRSDSGAFITAGGRTLDDAAIAQGSVVTVDGADGSTLALLHDPSLARDQPELLRAVAEAARLALDNQRLTAEVRLSRELPVSVTDRLLREGGRIGDVTMLEISVLMSDIRGYSGLAEAAELHDLAAQLNEHRAAMNRIIAAHGGTVMQFAGDMVFAVFGAPLPAANHASRAVDSAVEMHVAQRALDAQWALSGRQPFGLGIAVSSGEVAAALLGSAEHVEYSVVGDVVNLAQRLQAMAGPGEVVISEQTHRLLADSRAVKRLPTTTVKGRQAPVTAYLLAPA